MTLYEVLLFLHLAAVIIWLGAGFLIAVLIFGAERAGDRAKEGSYHRDVGWLAPRLFIPASLASLLLGILLVVEGEWGFGQVWITIALAGWAVSFLLGILYFKPEGERIGALVEQYGPGYREVDQRLHRLNIVDRVQLTILFLMVADMVVKPTGEDGGLLIAGAAILALALALAAFSIRRGPATPAAGESARV